MPSFAEGWKCALENSDLKKNKKKKNKQNDLFYHMSFGSMGQALCNSMGAWMGANPGTNQECQWADEGQKPAKVGQIFYGYNLTSPDPFWPETRIFNF